MAKDYIYGTGHVNRKIKLSNISDLLAIAVLINVVSSSLQISCPEVHQTPHKTLKLLRRNFMFVEKPFASLKSSLEIPLRVSRDVSSKMPGTSNCPWTWGQDDNPDRVPRYLTKAVCPSCKHYCRAVLYYHRGLVQRCDDRTGEKVWKWTVVELPVAFVYDP
ncbi:hypothetical protein ACROYT_G017947 [Oculina patagonica]